MLELLVNNFISIIVIIISAILAWFFTQPMKRISVRLPSILSKVDRSVFLYRRYLYSGGGARRFLFVLVVVSFSYVLIVSPKDSKFLENISYSIIAAFIFDSFLNYKKEQVSKIMTSRKWHTEYFACYSREKAIREMLLSNYYYKKLPSLTSYHLLVFKCLFEVRREFVQKTERQYEWYFDSQGIHYISSFIGMYPKDIILKFIREDAKFISDFYRDENVSVFFPEMNDKARMFNNMCIPVLNAIETKMGLQSSWYATDEQLVKDIERYFKCREVFLKQCDRHMGHYGH